LVWVAVAMSVPFGVSLLAAVSSLATVSANS
jgi:hypothetical protein